MNIGSPAGLLQALELIGAHPGLDAGQLSAMPEQEDFDGRLVEDIVIAAPLERARHLLMDVTAWTLLPYVHDARMTYDDGRYQELTIDLGSSGCIRSVRRCEPNHITFFEPKTVDFLKHHCGDWFLRALGPDATRLTAVQRWTLSPAGQRLPVAWLLRQQTRIALATWQRNLECGDGLSQPSRRQINGNDPY
jgi:hypothetical protein